MLAIRHGSEIKVQHYVSSGHDQFCKQPALIHSAAYAVCWSRGVESLGINSPEYSVDMAILGLPGA